MLEPGLQVTGHEVRSPRGQVTTSSGHRSVRQTRSLSRFQVLTALLLQHRVKMAPFTTATCDYCFVLFLSVVSCVCCERIVVWNLCWCIKHSLELLAMYLIFRTFNDRVVSAGVVGSPGQRPSGWVGLGQKFRLGSVDERQLSVGFVPLPASQLGSPRFTTDSLRYRLDELDLARIFVRRCGVTSVLL